MKSNQRIKYIDISRAFAIILIVLGHSLVYSNNCRLIYKFIYSFHVVLFFILSGFTFNEKKLKFIDFVKSKFLRIMIPYFIWSVLFLIPYFLFGTDVSKTLSTTASFDIMQQLKNILYGNGNMFALKQNSSLWFLPALFSMEIVFYLFLRLFNKKDSLRKDIFILCIIYIISFVFNYFVDIIFPWGINTVFELGSFFYIGILIKKYNIIEKINCKGYIIIPVFLILGAISCFLNNTVVSAIDYRYGIFILALFSGIFLSFAVILISNNIKQNHILEYIGKNTMGILIFHKLILVVFQTKIPYINTLLCNSNIIIELLISILISAIAISLSLIATSMIRKIFPFLFGEKLPINIIHYRTKEDASTL